MENGQQQPLSDFFFICGLHETDIISAPVLPSQRESAKSDLRREVSIPEHAVLDMPSELRPVSVPPIEVHRASTGETDSSLPTPPASVSSAEKNARDAAAERESNGKVEDEARESIAKPSSGLGFDEMLSKFTSARDNFILKLETPGSQQPIVSVPAVSETLSIPQGTPKASKHISRARIEDEDEDDPIAALSSPPLTRNSTRSHSRSPFSPGSFSGSFSDLVRGPSFSRRRTMKRQGSQRTLQRSSTVIYNDFILEPDPLVLPPGTHPMKRKFPPRLLSRWPLPEMQVETAARGGFPDYVPMFAFPNDCRIQLADERPQSTWHGFVMTKGTGENIHGMCVVIWVPLSAATAAVVDEQCEKWRERHMTSEERELAASLSSRLAAERTKLSHLLAGLAKSVPGPDREALEERITQCEEKIGLLTETLKPIRHGTAAKVEGLTEMGTGMWVPRAYGLLSRDGSFQTLRRDWLKAICTPMLTGEIIGVPPSSPRVGVFFPLERYAVNMCGDIPLPTRKDLQLELAVRELRLYAMREAPNESPGWRDVDLYPLFRALGLSNVIVLVEAALSEARIIFRSAHVSMLHLAAKALTHLIWPLKWTGVYIPVLPARLASCLEAPVSYIIGIEKRFENLTLPEEDFVLCDLDNDLIVAPVQPSTLPAPQRRKLAHLLSLAAPLHLRYGVQKGPPPYAVSTFPNQSFVASAEVATSIRRPSTLSKLLLRNSATFGEPNVDYRPQEPVFNAFLQSCDEKVVNYNRRPTTPFSRRLPSFASSSTSSPMRHGSQASITPPISRENSQARRASRLAFEGLTERNRSASIDTRFSMVLRPGAISVASNYNDNASTYGYSPSLSGQSTFAGSSVFNLDVLSQPIRPPTAGGDMWWCEGHCMLWKEDMNTVPTSCTVCGERSEVYMYACRECMMMVHHRCRDAVTLPCLPVCFDADKVRAAFLRLFASLLYTHRRFLVSVSRGKRISSNGAVFTFDQEGFVRSVPKDHGQYLNMLLETQAFSEFIHERCHKMPDDPEVMLFEQVIMTKKNRGRTGLKLGLFRGKRGDTAFLNGRSGSAQVQTRPAPVPQGDGWDRTEAQIGRTPDRLEKGLLVPGLLDQTRPKRRPVNGTSP
ncbi:hypothetical protein YB2330_002880 [Saitoella coloradoensis]